VPFRVVAVTSTVPPHRSSAFRPRRSCAGPITVPVARRLGPPGAFATFGGGGLMTQLSDQKADTIAIMKGLGGQRALSARSPTSATAVLAADVRRRECSRRLRRHAAALPHGDDDLCWLPTPEVGSRIDAANLA
jgi:hypothetical protein